MAYCALSIYCKSFYSDNQKEVQRELLHLFCQFLELKKTVFGMFFSPTKLSMFYFQFYFPEVIWNMFFLKE